MKGSIVLEWLVFLVIYLVKKSLVSEISDT